MKIILHKDWFKIKHIPVNEFKFIYEYLIKYENVVDISYKSYPGYYSIDIESLSSNSFTQLYIILHDLTETYDFDLC